MYEQWKSSVLSKVVGDGQCVSLIVNNPQSYVEALWPDENWEVVFAPVPSAKDLFNDANPAYFTRIGNNHNDPNQVPQQGDVMVFDATPEVGYTNTFNNPDGHTGVCDSANADGYYLLQQNSPSEGSPANVTFYPWRYRPCIGWLRPVVDSTPPVQAPAQPPVETPVVEAPQAPSQPQVDTQSVLEPATPPVAPTKPTEQSTASTPQLPDLNTTLKEVNTIQTLVRSLQKELPGIISTLVALASALTVLWHQLGHLPMSQLGIAGAGGITLLSLVGLWLHLRTR